MRFLQLKQIDQASQILTQFENEKPGLSFILEPYSCKTSKKQRKQYDCSNKENYIINNTLDLSFGDYTFESSKTNYMMVEKTRAKKIINEFMTITNIEMADENTDILINIIDKAVEAKCTQIYSYEMRDGPFEECALFFCLIFYSKKKKRVILFSGMQKK